MGKHLKQASAFSIVYTLQRLTGKADKDKKKDKGKVIWWLHMMVSFASRKLSIFFMVASSYSVP